MGNRMPVSFNINDNINEGVINVNPVYNEIKLMKEGDAIWLSTIGCFKSKRFRAIVHIDESLDTTEIEISKKDFDKLNGYNNRFILLERSE